MYKLLYGFILNYHFTLASIISLQFLQNALNVAGYPAVAIFVMIESSGIPFPGETMLLLASFYAALNNHLQIPIVIACAAIGAIVGDNLGFVAGRTGGKALVARYGRYVFLNPARMAQAETFFTKHGSKTVFFGRFISILRAWAAFLAGVNQMKWRTFLIYNAAGGIVWAIIYGLLGYYAGQLFHNDFGKVQSIAGTVSLIAGSIIVVVAIIIFCVVRYRRKHRIAKQSA